MPLLIEALAGTCGADLVFAASAVRLTKHQGALFVESVDEDALLRRLAFCGIRAEPVASIPTPPLEVLPAVGRSLEPLAQLEFGLDSLLLTPVDCGSVSKALLRRTWLRPLGISSSQRERCRSVLRGQDQAFTWERRAWLSRRAFRDPGVRAALRPIVFDQEAHRTRRSGGSAYASETLISRWAFR